MMNSGESILGKESCMCKGKNVRNVTAYSRRVSVYSYYVYIIINNNSGATFQVIVPKSVRYSHKFFVGNA